MSISTIQSITQSNRTVSDREVFAAVGFPSDLCWLLFSLFFFSLQMFAIEGCYAVRQMVCTAVCATKLFH